MAYRFLLFYSGVLDSNHFIHTYKSISNQIFEKLDKHLFLQIQNFKKNLVHEKFYRDILVQKYILINRSKDIMDQKDFISIF